MALIRIEPAQAISLQPPSEPLAMLTSALVKTDHFTAIHLVVEAGKEIPSHSVVGPLTLYCIEGHAELDLPDRTVTMNAGEWLFLEGGTPHAVRGIAASRLLLTVVLLE